MLKNNDKEILFYTLHMRVSGILSPFLQNSLQSFSTSPNPLLQTILLSTRPLTTNISSIPYSSFSSFYFSVDSLLQDLISSNPNKNTPLILYKTTWSNPFRTIEGLRSGHILLRTIILIFLGLQHVKDE